MNGSVQPGPASCILARLSVYMLNCTRDTGKPYGRPGPIDRRLQVSNMAPVRLHELVEHYLKGSNFSAPAIDKIISKVDVSLRNTYGCTRS